MAKRIILQLLVDEQGVYLSRRFKKQFFCSTKDINKMLKLDIMTNACDELLIQYVGEGLNYECIQNILSPENLGEHFIPVTIGGSVTSCKGIENLLKLGADKVVISSSSLLKPEIVSDMVSRFGSQAIVFPLQIKDFCGLDSKCVYHKRGESKFEKSLAEVIDIINKLKVGEIISYDIERDGSGTGYTLDLHSIVSSVSHAQVIASGGDGKSSDISEVLQSNIDGASISNLFAFMGGGIQRARQFAIEQNVDIVNWEEDVLLLNQDKKI